jgi:hypothetical protein
MSKKESYEMSLMMRGLVAEADAQVEFTDVMDSLDDIREEYMNGTEKQKIAFVAALTVFAIKLQDTL